MKTPANDAHPAFRCAVSAELFGRAMAAVATEETRYYLGGVFVQPCLQGGALLTSTNGHWLINVRDPRGVCEGSGIVSISKVMKAALKANRTDVRGPFGHLGERVLIVGTDGGFKDARAMVVLSGRPHTPKGSEAEVNPRDSVLARLAKPGRDVLAAQFSDVLIDGVYPEWKKIIPAEVDFAAPAPALDQRYVALAAKALSQDGKVQPIRLAPSKGQPSGPVLVMAANRTFEDWQALAVVMPVRAESALAVPTYWQDAAKAVAA